MKQAIAFFFFAVLIASCSNVSKYADMINELASKWDSTTAAVTDVSSTLSNTQSSWMSEVNAMSVAEETMAGWSEEMKTNYNEVMTANNSVSTDISNMSTELDGFISQWQEKAEVLKSLKEGLGSGKLGSGTESTINDLNAFVNEATSKLEQWQSRFSEVNMSVANAKQMFADLNAEKTSGTTK